MRCDGDVVFTNLDGRGDTLTASGSGGTGVPFASTRHDGEPAGAGLEGGPASELVGGGPDEGCEGALDEVALYGPDPDQ